jgi:hypothetical protein
VGRATSALERTYSLNSFLDPGQAIQLVIRGQWLKVPPAVVQDRGDNPTGDYVTCIIDAAEPEVLCFIKAPRT